MTTMELDEPTYDSSFGGSWWWLFLITGTLWFCLALLVFRFDLTSVSAIGILAGVVFVIAGVLELAMIAISDGGWWKALHALLAVFLLVGGIYSFVHPGDAFVAIASVTAFMLLFVGIWEILVAFVTRALDSMWWVRLIIGIASVLLAFWAAGEFGRKAVLLVTWVGAFCLIRGISSFFVAFALRSANKELRA
jgi:uncharacterized membrane protein HdeD (DUF308 family)